MSKHTICNRQGCCSAGKRAKTEPEEVLHRPNLYALLDLDPRIEHDRQKLDGDAIIELVQRNPNSAANDKYLFRAFANRSKEPCHPLHMAIMMGASTNVLDVLDSASPQGVTETCPIFCEGDTILHLACRHKASSEVISWIVQKFQGKNSYGKNAAGSTPLHLACGCAAPLEVVTLLLQHCPTCAEEKDNCGFTPLYYACTYNAPIELIAMLLKKGPGALRQKSNRGETVLHTACRIKATMEVSSLLVETWPESVKEKRNDGNTPLHFAALYGIPLGVTLMFLKKCPSAIFEKNNDGKTALHLACEKSGEVSIELIKLLLEKYPHASMERDAGLRTPLDHHYQSDEISIMLRSVSCLVTTQNQKLKGDEKRVQTILRNFIRMGWVGGVRIVLDLHPASFLTLKLQPKIMPSFLAMIGRSNKLMTIWFIISNKQDLFTST